MGNTSTKKPKSETTQLTQTPLPAEMWYTIFGFLRSGRDLINTKLACDEFNEIVSSEDNKLIKELESLPRDYTKQPACRRLCEFNFRVNGIVALPDGKIAFTTDYERTYVYVYEIFTVDVNPKKLRILDPKSGEITAEMSGFNGQYLICALPNSDIVSAQYGHENRQLHIWDINLKKPKRSIKLSHDVIFYQRTIQVLSDMEILVSDSATFSAYKINLTTGKCTPVKLEFNNELRFSLIPRNTDQTKSQLNVHLNEENPKKTYRFELDIPSDKKNYYGNMAIKLSNGMVAVCAVIPDKLRLSDRIVSKSQFYILSFPERELEPEQEIRMTMNP